MRTPPSAFRPSASGFWLRLRRYPHAHLVDAATLRFEHFDLQTVAFNRLADGRHPAGSSQHVAADRLDSLRLDLDSQSIAYCRDVDFRAEHKRPRGFLDHRFGLDVVLVANLTDDLLEQILNRHQTGRTGVFVDDDGDPDMLALKLLEHLGDPFRLGDEGRRPDESRQMQKRRLSRLRRIEPDQVLDEDKADDG